jgi:molybdate transport system substrate-binding protein
MRPDHFRNGSRSIGAPVLVLAFVIIVLPVTRAAEQPPLVAAASDLQFALESAASEFTARTGGRVELVFGSSGNLARQLMDGAPYELFLSADEGFVYKLTDAGIARDGGVLYGVGRLVIFAPRGSPLTVDEHLKGLSDLLARGGVTRFAIANPEHAPYGRAAEAALRAKGLWEGVQPRLVFGENVSQAAQFAITGNAVGGLIAYSLVLAPPLREKGTFALLPAALHPPLRQRMVLTKKAGAIAQRFYEFLQQPAARAILMTFGFALPQN